MVADNVSFTRALVATNFKATVALRGAFVIQVVVIAASAVIFVACGTVFFSLAFWLGRVETVATQLWELLVTFSLYPEPLFGGTLRLLLFTVLPAGFVGYLPVRILRAPSLANVTILMFVATGYLCLA